MTAASKFVGAESIGYFLIHDGLRNVSPGKVQAVVADAFADV